MITRGGGDSASVEYEDGGDDIGMPPEDEVRLFGFCEEAISESAVSEDTISEAIQEIHFTFASLSVDLGIEFDIVHIVEVEKILGGELLLEGAECTGEKGVLVDEEVKVLHLLLEVIYGDFELRDHLFDHFFLVFEDGLDLRG